MIASDTGCEVTTVSEDVATLLGLPPGGRELVMTMRANGAYTCLISGGFTLFTNAVAAIIGFQENRANRLGVENGKLKMSRLADNSAVDSGTGQAA